MHAKQMGNYYKLEIWKVPILHLETSPFPVLHFFFYMIGKTSTIMYITLCVHTHIWKSESQTEV